MDNKVLLIIMDGWGHGAHPSSDAIYQAHVPFVKMLYSKYPHAELITCGEAVGLPEGQMGNSEVGHMNIGAGRIVFQELLRINKTIERGDLSRNPGLLEALRYVKEKNKPLHLIGLVSDGGVHSHINHLKALCDIAKENGVTNVFIHAFTDGRDTDPKSGWGYLNDLQNHLQHSTGQVASVIGRYYAMDRDNRWQRVKLAYDVLVNGEGKKTNDLLQAISESYAEQVTDEFIKPIVKIDNNGNPISIIREGDGVICFNLERIAAERLRKRLRRKIFLSSA
jgi:2,3-bisphosphoglycerate-independent phosphoglycerate mutase